jgi:hypothetical protein
MVEPEKMFFEFQRQLALVVAEAEAACCEFQNALTSNPSWRLRLGEFRRMMGHIPVNTVHIPEFAFPPPLQFFPCNSVCDGRTAR